MLARPVHKKSFAIFIAALAAILCFTVSAFAQDAPYYSPDQLDHMVSRIALYPDPLLAQVLAGATYPEQIPDAARWSDEHHYMSGPQLADAINYDQLPWDPSVQALLPFPSVLDMMASDMHWTSDLGNAFLSNQNEVMYAVQRMRQRARDYGYLRTTPQVVVAGGPYITILPARADYVVVPYYDPVVVYERPRPGFFIGAAIGYRYNVFLGVAFRPWGWGCNRIGWNDRVVVINNAPWHRTWDNRTVYVHPYRVRRIYVADRDRDHDHEWREHERDRDHDAREHDRDGHDHDRDWREHEGDRDHDRDWRDRERHEVYQRSERERDADRWGHRRDEEHRPEVRRTDWHDDHGRGSEHRDYGHANGGPAVQARDNGNAHANAGPAVQARDNGYGHANGGPAVQPRDNGNGHGNGDHGQASQHHDNGRGNNGNDQGKGKGDPGDHGRGGQGR